MKDLEKRRDLFAVLLIFIAVLLVTTSISLRPTISGAIVSVAPNNNVCAKAMYHECASLCIEKDNDASRGYELPSDWFESCLDNCGKTAEEKCS